MPGNVSTVDISGGCIRIGQDGVFLVSLAENVFRVSSMLQGVSVLRPLVWLANILLCGETISIYQRMGH